MDNIKKKSFVKSDGTIKKSECMKKSCDVKLLIFIIISTLFFESCIHDKEKQAKNNLLPDNLRVVYSVLLKDTGLPENYQDISDINFNEYILKQVFSEKIQAYVPIDRGDYYPYSFSDCDSLHLVGIAERMKVISNYTAESLNKLASERTISTLFTEDWYYYNTDFKFEKKVIGFEPVILFYRNEDTTRQTPVMKKLFRIIPEKNMSEAQIKNSQARMKLVKKVEFEFYFNQSEFLLNQNDSLCASCLNNNGGILEDYFAPFMTSITRRKFVSMLLDKVLKDSMTVYSPYERNLKMTKDDVLSRLDALDQSTKVLDPETGEIKVCIAKGVINKDEIKSVIFIEEWYLDTESLRMEKKIIGIIPVRHYYRMDESEGGELVKKKLFLAYFNN
jgi:hypothetical protein